MPPPADAALSAPNPIGSSGFWVRGLRSAGFGVVIAAVLTMAFGIPLWSSLLHSVCIAIASWFAIDSGRLAVARWLLHGPAQGESAADARWPGWPWMLVIIFLGSTIGVIVGSLCGDWLSGTSTLPMSSGQGRSGLGEGVSVLVISLIPAIGITYWFYSRETIAAREAAVQTAQRQAAEHQLKLLESQLEPHMLFNTLANLRVLIALDPPRAQRMLDQLIAFLRATLDGSRAAQHPLRAEFARLGDYLALMQVRMGERLQSQFELPDALADVGVPPLLLQPLVENAIKHGLEPAVHGGRVVVSARRDGGELVLQVRDTGAGLTPASPQGTRFGLVQVRERLAALYGQHATLTLCSAADALGGTLATIRLPLQAER